jgi:hypothetical protein
MTTRGETTMNANGKCEVVRQSARQGLALAALLAIAPFAAGICRAQSGAKPGPGAPAGVNGALAGASASPAPKPPSRGTVDGIKVHGYWTIEVRNPDGKVAKHMEFENQLCTTFVDPVSQVTVPGGDSTLASLLTGFAAPGAWAIILGTPEPAGTVTLPGGGTAPVVAPNCAITSQFSLAQSGVQGGSSALANVAGTGGVSNMAEIAPFSLSCSGNCTPALGESLTNFASNITLSGQMTAPTGMPAATITAVGTDLFTCKGGAGGLAGAPSTPSSAYSCLEIGNNYATSLSSGSCSVGQEEASAGGGGPTMAAYKVTFLDCTPGFSTLSVVTETYPVAGQPGRSPFSGVVLTGTNGVPGPFTVSGGQTIAVTWNLSFQ